jgi:hypothetical protein
MTDDLLICNAAKVGNYSFFRTILNEFPSLEGGLEENLIV